MITLTIDDREIEDLFIYRFKRNKEKFFEFIKEFVSYEERDSDYIAREYEKGEKSGICEKSHEQIWKELHEKYASN